MENVEEELANFRELWQNELSNARQLTFPRSEILDSEKQEIKRSTLFQNAEEQAKALFMEASKLEQNGKLYEAVQYYKRAVQLVPDIEYKIREKKTDIIGSDTKQTQKANEKPTCTKDEKNINDDVIDIYAPDLVSRLQLAMDIDDCQTFCVPKFETKGLHISQLPIEIMMYILKWVVSSELDLRSLEMCSMVSRGFYLLARDSEIWRLACIKAWGPAQTPQNLISSSLEMNLSMDNRYLDWRDMFLRRSRLNYNGCYISKTTYLRPGEEGSFQDRGSRDHRPWHIVTYYRYLRFFPNGIALMLTTPDEPAQCVSLLRHHSSNKVSPNTTIVQSNTINNQSQASILTGRYSLDDDTVTVWLSSASSSSNGTMNKQSNKRNYELQPSQQHVFHLQLKIHMRKRHTRLLWLHFSIHTIRSSNYGNAGGVDIPPAPPRASEIAEYELGPNRFPPLWFSRVKSYTLTADSPLQ